MCTSKNICAYTLSTLQKTFLKLRGAKQTMISFQSWVDRSGGTERVARKLGTTNAAVKRWVNKQGWPKVETILDLIEISKGELTFETIIQSTKPSKAKRH
jgi:DNA-binding phage protein